MVSASPPLADPADTRFGGVKEDWTSPGIATSNLRPVMALTGYSNDREGYTEQLVRLQWRFGDPVDVYIMRQIGAKNPPVILYLYGYPADTERFKTEAFQKKVTRDGFAAVGFTSALTGERYHDRPMKEWFVSELQESLAASAHDVQMIINYLASRGDLDMDRLGMYAQGSGASIGILASAADPRIKVLDLLDPWGDWPTWMATSPFVPEDERPEFVKPEFLKKAAVLEPVDWLPKMQAAKVRMQDAIFEKTTPKAAKEKLRAAVPQRTNVVIYKAADDFNAMVKNGEELKWIETELRSFGASTVAGSTP
jgi:hypothetical protein